jgi:hypothetical protein
MTAGLTYVPIATTAIGSAASSYTFSSIPSTYTDLILISNLGQSINGTTLSIQFNGDTGTNYSITELYGNGSSASSSTNSNQTSIYLENNIAAALSVSTSIIVNVMNYSNTITNKTIISRANNTDSTTPGTNTTIGLWRSTSAINSLTIKVSSGNIITGSTFTIYGIAAA